MALDSTQRLALRLAFETFVLKNSAARSRADYRSAGPHLYHSLAARCQVGGTLFFVKQRVDKFGRHEGAKVVGAFAEADELDRHFQLVDDRDQDATLRGRVELRDDDAGELRGSVKELGLRNGVLAVGSVDDEQRFGRRLAELALDHSAHLL